MKEVVCMPLEGWTVQATQFVPTLCVGEHQTIGIIEPGLGPPMERRKIHILRDVLRGSMRGARRT